MSRLGYRKYLDSFNHVEIMDDVTLEYKFKHKSLEEMASKVKEGSLTQKVFKYFILDLKESGENYYDSIERNLRTYLVPSPVVKDVVVFLNRSGKNVVEPNSVTGLINRKTWKRDEFFLIYGDGDKVWLGTIKNDSPLNLLKKWISSYGSQQLREFENRLKISKTLVAGRSSGEYGFDKDEKLFSKQSTTPSTKNEMYENQRSYELKQKNRDFSKALKLVGNDKSMDLSNLLSSLFFEKDTYRALVHLTSLKLVTTVKLPIKSSLHKVEEAFKVLEKVKKNHPSSKLELSNGVLSLKI